MDREGLEEIVGEKNVKEQEPLSAHTTFRIGGPARFFVTPESVEELIKVLSYLKESGEDYVLLGNGSNLLVKDAGYAGVVISTHSAQKKEQTENLGASFLLHEYREVSHQEFSRLLERYTGKAENLTETNGRRLIVAGSGILLSALANGIAKKGLSGFEFASGIPGTLGGAVVMNAGAYGGEVKDSILGAVVLSGDGRVQYIKKEELHLGYRSSRIQKENSVVLFAAFAFGEGNVEEIEEKMHELNQRRREKQPLQYGSAGSTFKRPEGHFAGKLIEDAGLKGYRVGDVMVSEKHAGFVVNVGNGTYEQAAAVIRHVQEEVKKQSGVELETEVKIL